MKKRVLAGLLAGILVTSSAPAAMLTWTVVDGKFSDGGSFSGSFTYEDVDNYFGDWHIVTSPAGDLGDTYDANLGQGAGISGADVFFDHTSGDFSPDYSTRDLFFSGFDPSTAGTVTLAGSEVFSNCTLPLGCTLGASRTITGGTITTDAVATSAAPEPATWLAMIAGFGMIGTAMRFRHRRAITA